LDSLAVNYGAGLNLVDFATAPDAARLTVNACAADKTKHKIVEAMPEGSIDAGTFVNYSAGFEASKLSELTDTLQSKGVIVMLPKFDFGSDIPLSEVLKALGVADAFTGNADFSGIDGSPKNLRITSAVHKAHITVDEAGAEAVGFTGFVTGPTSIPQTVVLDRPFLFLIRDVETNSVLFVGRVLDPAVK